MSMAKGVLAGKGRRTALGVVLYLGAVLVGLGSAWWVLKKSPFFQQAVQVGAWKANLLAGSTDAGMYTRAAVALNAFLALDRTETMYFMATQDDAGQALRSQCKYRVEGVPPAARWWSITAYADDLFLFDAPNQQHSLNGSTAQLDAQGRFVLQTGPQPVGGAHWLPTPGQQGVVLILRLYNPEPSLQASPASLVPPTLVRQGACP
jgi:hypothetical protein